MKNQLRYMLHSNSSFFIFSSSFYQWQCPPSQLQSSPQSLPQLSHPQPQPSPLIIFTSSWISSLVAGRLSMTSPSKNRSAPANGWLRSTITTSCWISTTLAFTRWPSPVIKGTMLPSCTRSLSNLPSISKICLGRSNTCCSSYAPYALSAGMVKSNLSPLERVVIWFSKL